MSKFEYYKDKARKWRFRLKAENGKIVAVSEAYESKNNCLLGIESIKRIAVDAVIVEDLK